MKAPSLSVRSWRFGKKTPSNPDIQINRPLSKLESQSYTKTNVLDDKKLVGGGGIAFPSQCHVEADVGTGETS